MKFSKLSALALCVPAICGLKLSVDEEVWRGLRTVIDATVEDGDPARVNLLLYEGFQLVNVVKWNVDVAEKMPVAIFSEPGRYVIKAVDVDDDERVYTSNEFDLKLLTRSGLADWFIFWFQRLYQ